METITITVPETNVRDHDDRHDIVTVITPSLVSTISLEDILVDRNSGARVLWCLEDTIGWVECRLQ